MSNIRVRRSGLITFAIKLGSTLTGLAFVVLVTSNLTQSDFGLWQLISRVIAYVVFAGNVLNFWTTRYRARGMQLGKTVIIAGSIFSAVMSLVYLGISYGVAGSVSSPAEYSTNLFFFLFSAPQVPLYIIAAVIEAILWGSAPERASLGFGLFEIAKVAIGGIAVGVFHLSLEGAIIGVMGAQLVQIISTGVLTRREYGDHVSFPLISRMVKTGWMAILNQIQPLVINFDFLIVALITTSTLPIALYGAAYVFGAIITYSGWLAAGLYAGLLSGKDPSKSTSQVLEIQYAFILPMVIGEIVLATRLLHLLNPLYTTAAPILIALAIASAFAALSQTFDNVITGTDTTDSLNTADFSLYIRSKLFLVAKINIVLASGYLVFIGVLAHTIGLQTQTMFGLQPYSLLGMAWGASGLCMWGLAVALKLKHVRKISKISVPLRTGLAYILGSIGFATILYRLDSIVQIPHGEIVQAIYILGIGAVALSVYSAIVLSVSPDMRKLVRNTVAAIRG
ncbi:MAG: hypothetical protein M1587_01385 [Thaumarchaeota archaeon]|nr:hypothetical protein [Nitrososphaerota archaeon]